MPVTESGPRSVADLCRLQTQGHRMEFLFFCGHGRPASGDVGKGCLSQWYEGHGFTVDGMTYRTAEHWMMAHKARLFGDEQTFARIVESEHPRQAKELGRGIDSFDETTWVNHRFGIVTAGNLAKFGQHPELRDYLLGTGSRILVEASPVDRVWGIGLAADDDRAVQPHRWRGLNLLGFALMEARALLAEP
ncbi:MAG: DUF1768 domain-containing protein [Streptosporangiales bacterium]|nr:DUF1768 domain-containing protein [Streptosporangiales bacterium]